MVATMTETHVSEKERIYDWIRQWGCSTSEVIMDIDCQLFSAPGIDGFIGYRPENGTAVVFGDPICAPEDMEKLALASKNTANLQIQKSSICLHLKTLPTGR